MSIEWPEAKAILTEVEQLYCHNDDIGYIQDIKKMAKEIESQYSIYANDTKDIIKKLTCKISEKESEILAPSETEHATKVEKITMEKENAYAQCENIRQVTDAKREKISKLAADTLSVRERAAEYTVSSQISDSRTAYALSLFAKISNITWDYTAPAGKLSGCIGNDTDKVLKNFTIDTRSRTSFEVTNDLWELISEGIEDDGDI